MRVTLVLVVLVAACWTSSPRERVAAPIASTPPPPLATCEHAAHAIALVVGMRSDEYAVASCRGAHWTESARACFARMIGFDGFSPCTERLDDDAREQLFRAIEDPEDERLTVAIAVARLAHVHTGIAECDALAAAVSRAFTCDAIPLGDRVLLGDMTGDFSNATNPRLRARFAALCTKSIADVQQQTAAAGCAP